LDVFVTIQLPVGFIYIPPPRPKPQWRDPHDKAPDDIQQWVRHIEMREGTHYVGVS